MVLDVVQPQPDRHEGVSELAKQVGQLSERHCHARHELLVRVAGGALESDPGDIDDSEEFDDVCAQAVFCRVAPRKSLFDSFGDVGLDVLTLGMAPAFAERRRLTAESTTFVAMFAPTDPITPALAVHISPALNATARTGDSADAVSAAINAGADFWRRAGPLTFTASDTARRIREIRPPSNSVEVSVCKHLRSPGRSVVWHPDRLWWKSSAEGTAGLAMILRSDVSSGAEQFGGKGDRSRALPHIEVLWVRRVGRLGGSS